MDVRKRRRSNKLRGQRTHGKGDTKNKRGAGNRGGVGRAGSHKHKYTKYYGQFGVEKKQLIGKDKGITLKIEDIETMIPKWENKKLVDNSGKQIVLDGKKIKVRKIVATGDINTAVTLVNIEASKRAEEKIVASGGKVEKPETSQEESE
jgi:large subunit ribosomal protein L15